MLLGDRIVSKLGQEISERKKNSLEDHHSGGVTDGIK